MKRLFILLILLAACTHTPPKTEYRWVSLSDQAYAQNNLTVNKETTDFYNAKGFSDLEMRRMNLSEGGQTPFPLKKDHLQKIILLGDTGCRLKESKKGSVYQDCNDPTDWTYPTVALKIAAEKPDLIIHVGDYLY